MVRVYVCLPKIYLYYIFEHCVYPKDFLAYFQMSCNNFFRPYKMTDRFIDSTEFGIDTYINIPKKGIKKIKDSTKMQDYFSDNSKNDMMVIRYHNGYAIISPECFSHIEHEGNPESIIEVDRTPFIVWLKKEELFPFLKNYNDLIKKDRMHYLNKIEEDKRQSIEFELKLFIKRNSYLFVIGGIIIFILFQMCSN